MNIVLSLIKNINTVNIILASASPRRLELLNMIGLNFRVIPSHIEEIYEDHMTPVEYVLENAKRKGHFVARQYPESLVISADTIVVYNNRMFGKPKNIRAAKVILSALSGTKHFVYTAIAVIDTKENRRIVDIEKTTIFARILSQHQINIFSKKNHDKAG